MPSNASSITDFQVRRDDLRQCRVTSLPLPELKAGEVLLRVDAFALTANNVTYAVFGDLMRYWEFFPAPEGWGHVPVWGFADVVASRHPAVVAGERFYGYFPISSHLLVQPEDASATGFVDGAPHRRELPPVYNRYVRTKTDPSYDPRQEDAQMLLRPLFATSYLLDDFLAEHQFHGARAIALSSASSKTAMGLAFLLSTRAGRAYEVIGLTSKGNAEFVRSLGFYDRVATYDALDQLPHDLPMVFVDMAGNGEVRDTVHRHCGERLRFSCAVGGTHWGSITPAGDLPGPQPTFFFAPDRVRQRTADWGGTELYDRIGAALRRFLEALGPGMKVQRGRGSADVERVYLAMVDGRADPAVGHVLSL
jgi:hypothetical protein